MIPPLSMGRGLKDPKLNSVAEAIAAQNGMIKDISGHNPVVDYIVEKAAQAKNSKKAKG